MAAWKHSIVEGEHSNYYKYALRLTRNNYTNLKNFDALRKAKRGVEIWEWKTNVKGKRQKTLFTEKQ